MIEHPVIQGSPEWFNLRKGRPTGSEFSRIVTPAKLAYAKGADVYMNELIAESLGEHVSEWAGSPDTERGHFYEKEALRWLEFRHKIKTRDVGFITDDRMRYGVSPDALTVDGGEPAEVKAPRVKMFLGWLDEYEATGCVPMEHKVQVHAEMIATGKDRCHFIAYVNSEYLDNLYIEVKRDDDTKRIEDHIETFCALLEQKQRARLGDFFDEIFPERGVA